MKIAFQMDPLERLNKKGDSTLSLARAAAGRGYELFHYEPGHLQMVMGPHAPKISAAGHTLLLDKATDDWKLGEQSRRDLSGFDVILMRQDPPFDMAYITATHILENLPKKTRVINDPVGVRNAPEKLLISLTPQFLPPTLIARDREAIEEFRKQHGDIILKPLHGYAGHGIFHLRTDDNNLAALLETLGERTNEPWMVQKFLPVATQGDKRVVIMDGEPVGVFTRFPEKNETRGNMRVGGRPEPATL
ncbi:MAG TPA: glutathione synthase, partial [Alphaproteobacteria bacterium]|nr:glutathione synthase [Alphaproteobacteria bacterium]